ncbi:hypothetical protein, partial [Streptomyces sp. NPDC127574]|uniref:hypothetical protein n=1 Tax=Streptomyces sp. NPDC127574 TaxID=3345401 RepID=UPI00363CD694
MGRAISVEDSGLASSRLGADLAAPVVGGDRGLRDLGGRLLALRQRPVLGEEVVGPDERARRERCDEQRQHDLPEALADLPAHEQDETEAERPGQEQALQPERVDDRVVVGVRRLLRRGRQQLDQREAESELDGPAGQSHHQPDEGEQAGHDERVRVRLQGEDRTALRGQLVPVDRDALGAVHVERGQQALPAVGGVGDLAVDQQKHARDAHCEEGCPQRAAIEAAHHAPRLNYKSPGHEGRFALC